MNKMKHYVPKKILQTIYSRAVCLIYTMVYYTSMGIQFTEDSQISKGSSQNNDA